MEIKVIKDEKNNLVVELDNQTIAELLRVYLNRDSDVEFAAWKRQHPDNPVIFEIKTSGKDPKKIIDSTISLIEKELLKLSDDFKKELKA